MSGQANRFEGSRVQVEPGGVFRRFIAIIIDGIVLNIITFPLLFLVGGAAMFDPEAAQVAAQDPGAFVGQQILINGMSFVIACLYSGFMLSKKGATLGRMALGLSVVDANSGQNLSFVKGAFRDTIGRGVSGILLGAGYLMALFRSDKKALHDLMFSSSVLKR